MARTDIPPGARVDAADGELGRVRHVVVDPASRDVTDVVVEQGGRQWLIPVSAVAGVEGDRVTLQGERAQFPAGFNVDLTAFEALEIWPGEGDTVGGFALQRRPQRLQLKEEVLRVTTTEEQAGVVRVSTRITERTETISVPVRETRLVIEVVPGSGTARVGDRELHEGESIEVLLSAERISVSKEVVAREDVIVRTAVVEREEQIQETVRREELVVDQQGDLIVEPLAAGSEPAR